MRGLLSTRSHLPRLLHSSTPSQPFPCRGGEPAALLECFARCNCFRIALGWRLILQDHAQGNWPGHSPQSCQYEVPSACPLRRTPQNHTHHRRSRNRAQLLRLQSRDSSRPAAPPSWAISGRPPEDSNLCYLPTPSALSPLFAHREGVDLRHVQIDRAPDQQHGRSNAPIAISADHAMPHAVAPP